MEDLSFPEDEIEIYRQRLVAGLPVYTTRVSAECGKYCAGDVLNSPFGLVRIEQVDRFAEGVRHPFHDELTAEQLAQITGAFDLVRFSVVPDRDRKASPPRGFSLIEAAIVLAVVGLVIGGIWAAAANLSFHFREQKFLQGFVTLQNNVNKYLTQSIACTHDMTGGTGGMFIYGTMYDLLRPDEWDQIDTGEFCGWDCGVTQFACDTRGVRYYSVFFRTQGTAAQCQRYFDYLSSRNYLVGWNGVMGQNNCGGSAFYQGFNVFFEISNK